MMRALMRWVAEKIPASSNEIIKRELAVFDVVSNNLLSVHGIRIPTKMIVSGYS